MNESMITKPRSAGGARSLPGEFVTSPEIFRLEAEHVFQRNWICLARESQLDATSQCRIEILDSHHLLLLRGDDGRVRAFRNVCRHRGSQLVTPDDCAAVGRKIRCAYHGWTYDRQGNLVGEPNMADVENFRHAEFGLIEIPCQTWHGLIWICFQPVNSLESLLMSLEQHAVDWSFSELDVAGQLEYRVRANWKLIFQNYSECYHCPTVHPALNRLTPYKQSSNDLVEGPILGGPMNLADDCQTMSSDGQTVGRYLPNLNAHQRRIVFYYTVFPSLFISLHPDFVMLHYLRRLDFDQTMVTCQFLFHPASTRQTGFDPQRAMEFWDQTNRQDWQVCELTQRGMSDPGYLPGPYSNLESMLAAFDRHYFEIISIARGGTWP